MSSRQASTSCSKQSCSTIPNGYVTREDFERLISLVETSFKSIHAKIDRLTAEVADINLAIRRLDGPHGNGPEAQPTEPHSQTRRVSESSLLEKGSDREDTSEGRTLDETTNQKDTPGLTPERKADATEVVPNASGARRKLPFKDESLRTEPRNPEFKEPYPSRGQKKNGEPNMRLKENRQRLGGCNKDGSPDMRLKENRRALDKRNIDGTPDMRFKCNKEKFGKNR